MALSALEISALIFLVIVLIFVFYRYVKVNSEYESTKKQPIYMSSSAVANTADSGMVNVTDGSTLDISCPVGYTLEIDNIFVNGGPAAPSGQVTSSGYNEDSCWVELSKSGPGYPLSGTFSSNSTNKDTKYLKHLGNLKSKHDGSQEVKIKADQSDISEIVKGYLNSDLKNKCDAAYSANNTTLVWAPLVTVVYHCNAN